MKLYVLCLFILATSCGVSDCSNSLFSKGEIEYCGGHLNKMLLFLSEKKICIEQYFDSDGRLKVVERYLLDTLLQRKIFDCESNSFLTDSLTVCDLNRDYSRTANLNAYWTEKGDLRKVEEKYNNHAVEEIYDYSANPYLKKIIFYVGNGTRLTQIFGSKNKLIYMYEIAEGKKVFEKVFDRQLYNHYLNTIVSKNFKQSDLRQMRKSLELLYPEK